MQHTKLISLQPNQITETHQTRKPYEQSHHSNNPLIILTHLL